MIFELWLWSGKAWAMKVLFCRRFSKIVMLWDLDASRKPIQTNRIDTGSVKSIRSINNLSEKITFIKNVCQDSELWSKNHRNFILLSFFQVRPTSSTLTPYYSINLYGIGSTSYLCNVRSYVDARAFQARETFFSKSWKDWISEGFRLDFWILKLLKMSIFELGFWSGTASAMEPLFC